MRTSHHSNVTHTPCCTKQQCFVVTMHNVAWKCSLAIRYYHIEPITVVKIARDMHNWRICKSCCSTKMCYIHISYYYTRGYIKGKTNLAWLCKTLLRLQTQFDVIKMSHIAIGFRMKAHKNASGTLLPFDSTKAMQ